MVGLTRAFAPELAQARCNLAHSRLNLLLSLSIRPLHLPAFDTPSSRRRDATSHTPPSRFASCSAPRFLARAQAVGGGGGIKGRELGLLAQMVENRVVGAPCGVMDQMASLLGRANKLLALLCQVSMRA